MCNTTNLLSNLYNSIIKHEKNINNSKQETNSMNNHTNLIESKNQLNKVMCEVKVHLIG